MPRREIKSDPQVTAILKTLQDMSNQFNMANRTRANPTIPNLPIVEEGSIDSTDGGVPLTFDTVNDRFAGLRVNTTATSKSETNYPVLTTSTTPHPSKVIDINDHTQRQNLISRLQSNTKLDPTTTAFKPTDTFIQSFMSFCAPEKPIQNQYASGNTMAVSMNDHSTGIVADHNPNGFDGLVNQNNGITTKPSIGGANSSTFQQSLNVIKGANGMTFDVSSGKGMQQQQQQQQQGTQTPMRNDGMSSPLRFTPSSYRFTPHSSVTSSTLGSPVGSATSIPAYTEPRNFAPRTNGTITSDPPPRFVLRTPAPILQNLDHGNGVITPSHSGNERIHITPDRSLGSTFDNGSRGFDPFRVTELPSVIKPIEPLSNALVLHNNYVPDYIRQQRSKQLNELTNGPTQRPTAEVALDTANFPFVEGARNAQATPGYGVVKLKNIPFSSRRTEVLAFLGRNSKVLNDSQEPVHIIMERVTSKTNDAYVEFISMQAAVNAVEKHNKTVANGRLSRLGDRPVDVELSSQAALMKDLFPHATGIRWDGPTPVILEDHPTEPWNCFKGFVTQEEMICLVKHVEIPQRSPFSKDCPQRPYECMISTLRKFPWHMTNYITIKQRHSIYAACVALIRHLQYDLREKKFEECLTEQLYKRLWTSAMLCHGFTVTMKDSIGYIVGLPEDRMREFNMPRFGNLWTHAYTITPKPGIPLDVLEWYIAIIREETHRTVSISLPNIQAELHKEGEKTSLYWGFFFKECSHPVGEAFDNMTLAEMATREFTAITNILHRALAQ